MFKTFFHYLYFPQDEERTSDELNLGAGYEELEVYGVEEIPHLNSSWQQRGEQILKFVGNNTIGWWKKKNIWLVNWQVNTHDQLTENKQERE